MRNSARFLPGALRAAAQSASVQACEVQGGFVFWGSTHSRVPQPLGIRKPWLRTFLSKPVDGEEEFNDDLLREKLRKIAHVVRLQQDLRHESELRDSIPSEKLLQLILDRGAARDQEEADELVTAMQRAGVMLLHNKQAYLKPGELVEHRLPDFANADDLRAKLLDIRQKLKPFEEIHKAAEQRAWRLLYGCCFVLFLQLVAFLRLTYVELSWDVMEPIGYMISLFYSLLGYWFLIYTKGHPFDLQPVKEWYVRQVKAERAASLGGIDLDEERYEALVKARDRCIKRLQFIERLEAKDAAEAT